MSRWWNRGAVAALVLLAAVPMLLSIGYALLYSFGLVGALNKGFTTLHWQRLMGEGALLRSLSYSALLSAATLILVVVVALPLALKHHASFRSGFYGSVIYLPLAVPALVSAFFIFQLLSGGGLIARIAYQMGLIASSNDFPDLVNDPYGIGILMAQFFILFPVFFLLFVTRIRTERIGDYLALAHSLGARRGYALRKVALPILLRKTLPNLLLYFIFLFGAYEIPLLLGRSEPEVMSILAVRKLQRFNLADIPQGYAVAVVYTAITLLFLLLFIRRQHSAHEH